MTRGPRAALTAAIVAMTLVAAAPALADTTPVPNPFTPLAPTNQTAAPTTTAAPTVVTTTDSSGGGLSGGAAVAIGVGAIVLLGGIAFFIMRDARRHAPVRSRTATATGVVGPGEGRPGTKRPTKPRKLSPAERRRRKRGRAR